MNMQQAPAHDPSREFCLRFPGHLPPRPDASHEHAVKMLMSVVQASMTQPYMWDIIDKPQPGSVYIICIADRMSHPHDGLRFLEEEQMTRIPQTGFELEIGTTRFGFAPGQPEPYATTVRFRYRLSRGGNSTLWLYHYTRAPQGTHIPPSLHHAPVRRYPLPAPPQSGKFVAGPNRGHNAPRMGPGAGPGGAPGPPGYPGAGGGAVPMAPAEQAALLAQRHRAEPGGAGAVVGGAGGSGGQGLHLLEPSRPEPDLDEEGDEDALSTRTLASARYRRNHEWMEGVFKFAAYGDKSLPPPPPTLLELYPEDETQKQLTQLEEEIAALQAKSQARARARSAGESGEVGDVAMEVSSVAAVGA